MPGDVAGGRNPVAPRAGAAGTSLLFGAGTRNDLRGVRLSHPRGPKACDTFDEFPMSAMSKMKVHPAMLMKTHAGTRCHGGLPSILGVQEQATSRASGNLRAAADGRGLRFPFHW